MKHEQRNRQVLSTSSYGSKNSDLKFKKIIVNRHDTKKKAFIADYRTSQEERKSGGGNRSKSSSKFKNNLRSSVESSPVRKSVKGILSRSRSPEVDRAAANYSP